MAGWSSDGIPRCDELDFVQYVGGKFSTEFCGVPQIFSGSLGLSPACMVVEFDGLSLKLLRKRE